MPRIKPVEKFLKDYQKPDFHISKVKLDFDIKERRTIVVATLEMLRTGSHQRPLVLNGEELELLLVAVDDRQLNRREYRVTDEQLIIKHVPNKFILTTKVKIKPQKNSQLEGLYKSKGNFFTQCEPHGFRRITYYLDRPDVMAEFYVSICAPANYPYLLSNGNLIAKNRIVDGRRRVVWHDPSLKPCYLFALVVGDFSRLHDTFITKSGRIVDLFIYVEKGQRAKAKFALEALKRAMYWDERVYGREYDLDIYMIVAVSDFNVGAMENKGLNLFNSKYVLADAKTATDDDYVNIESVVAHEYFHNWSGNRVTCRDWFQLSLKEGLTVFRDQQFTADMTDAVVKRIQDVNVMRTVQFAEDSGPMSHPVQPKSYVAMNNFYTVTVYDKGAELVRMLSVILGKTVFRKAMNLYFKRYDGQAVTINEFVVAMEDASGIDFTQFKRWYHTAGTPKLKVTDEYDVKKQRYTIVVKQDKQLHIPLAVGLLNQKKSRQTSKTYLLNIHKKDQRFVFDNISYRPLPSLLRNFSAPVIVNYPYKTDDLLFLMLHDSDNFNRWNAAQQIWSNIIFALIKDYQQGSKLVFPSALLAAWRTILLDIKMDNSFKAQMLNLPNELYIIEQSSVADVEAIYNVHQFLRQQLAQQLGSELYKTYLTASKATEALDYATMGWRKIANICLKYLLMCPNKQELSVAHYNSAKNMTNMIGALAAINNSPCKQREKLFARFYKRWQREELVVNKWLELNALAQLPDTLDRIEEIFNSDKFDLGNPNQIYALLRAFSRQNYYCFHDAIGKGYKFLADCVLKIDQRNPQVAAIIVNPLIHWRKFDGSRQLLMLAQLKRIKQQHGLSKNLYEIVNKGLK